MGTSDDNTAFDWYAREWQRLGTPVPDPDWFGMIARGMSDDYATSLRRAGVFDQAVIVLQEQAKSLATTMVSQGMTPAEAKSQALLDVIPADGPADAIPPMDTDVGLGEQTQVTAFLRWLKWREESDASGARGHDDHDPQHHNP